MDKTAEEFWREFEARTGEKPLVIGMGQIFAPGDTKGEWGLVFFTDKNLRCRHMPSQGGFFGLLFNQGSSQKPKEESEDVYPLESILEVQIPRRGLKDKLFGPPFHRFSVTISEQGGGTKTIGFATDPGQNLPEKLRSHLETFRSRA